MFGFGKKKINSESYKGVRDFYPHDQAIQNYIFGVMRGVVLKWGYEEYGASLLEPLDLYRAKSSEEIVSEQIYSFEDRGGREVALRPEMTPTVARMAGSKIQDLPPPIRWYSIANFFRYEKPQRGRFREFWQLNVDIFGVKNYFAEVELINIASEIMKSYGAKNEDFIIRINSRGLLEEVLKSTNVDEDKKNFVFRLIDKKAKMKDSDFRHSLETLIGGERASALMEKLYYGEGLLSMVPHDSSKSLLAVIQSLRSRGVENIVFDPTLTRGFDYYTGIVFEVFDTNSENPRSLFGGGRYDNLVGAFAGQDVAALGFGMGDVTIRDFLTTHNLLPEMNNKTSVCLCVVPDTDMGEVYKIADSLRELGASVMVDISGKKLSDQLKNLEKRNVSFVIPVGTEELQSQKFTIRDIATREEKSGTVAEIAEILKNR